MSFTIMFHYRKLIFGTLLVYQTLLFEISAFDNNVIPKCSPDVEICSFEMHVERRRSMVLYGRPKNSTLARDNARYIMVRDGIPYKRDNDQCDHLEPLTKEEINKAIIGDGDFNFVYTINGQFPGPTLVVYYGQEIEVKVTNHLYQESLTIHWHGLRQVNTNWMDGVPSVTQCAIGPEETFTYRFLADPVGTHWYHSHQGAQRSDGMYGTIVILPKPRPQAPHHLFLNEDTAIHKDFVLMVQDWYPGGSNKLFHTFYYGLAKYGDHGMENTTSCDKVAVQADGTEIGPIPYHSALINGRGYRDGKFISEDFLESFIVEPGKRYRFRIINPGLLYTFKVSIDQHTMSVVSSDGDDLNPVTSDALYMSSGERFDVILHTNQKAGSYWIRVETLHWDLESGKPKPYTVLGVLKYSTTNEGRTDSLPKPCTQQKPCVHVNCAFREFPENQHIRCINIGQLTSPEIANLPIKPKSLKQIFLTFQFTNTTDGDIRSGINGIQYLTATKSTKPGGTTFVKDCSHSNCNHGPCRCTNVLPVSIGTTVQMVLTSQMFEMGDGTLAGSSHPVHLHGHHFHVLKVGYPVYNKTTKVYEAMNPHIHCPDLRCMNASWSIASYNDGDIPGMNLINPPKKDTVHVPSGGYVVIRFEADNPGFWMLHCHIENHNLEGMSLILKEGEIDEMNPPPPHFPVCGTFELSHEEFKGNLQNPLRLDPLYITWIPAMILLSVISNFIVAFITWKCAKKDNKIHSGTRHRERSKHTGKEELKHLL